MKGRVSIRAIRVEAEIDSDDPEVKERCQQIIDNAYERIEAAIAEAVCAELKNILPGITAVCTEAYTEDEEDL